MNLENIMLNEKNQSPKTICCMIAFIWKCRIGKLIEKECSGFVWLGEWEKWVVAAEGHRVTFGGEENIPTLDNDISCT